MNFLIDNPIPMREEELKLTDEAEKTVLGSILLKEELFERCVNILSDTDFYFKNNKIVFNAMKRCYDAGKPIEWINVSNIILSDGTPFSFAYVTEISFEYIVTFVHFNHQVERIKEQSIRRQAYLLAEKIKEIADNHILCDSTQDFIGHIDNAVEKLKRQATNTVIKNIGDSKKDFFDYLNKKDSFLKTGFYQFDEKIGGLGRGWLYILSARTSVGKTAKALQMTTGVLKHNENAHVLFFSQEMRKEELLMRLVANEKAIPVGVLTKRSFDEKDLTHIKLAIERLEKLNLFVYDKGDCSIDKIKAYAREHKRKYGELSLIVVDYLQILNIKETGKGTRSQAVGSVTRQAKQLAMELNCCFMMLSQLSRPKDKQDEVPQLHHLRDSGEIEQDADVVEFLHNDIGKRNTDGEFVVSTIAKGRATGTGEFYLRFAKWYQRFKEIPKNTSEG